jgi:FAD/FMN-containing dehydrogenase
MLKKNGLAEAKEAKIATEWASIPDSTFEALGASRAEMEEFERRIRGSVVLPGAPNYDDARDGNPLYPASPLVLVYCAVPEDVRLSLAAARAHHWPLTCRAGGHSAGGFSLNNGLVLDVSLINHVVVNRPAMQAQVGSGANFGQVNSVCSTYGVHVPGGTCDDVGVAGYVQGGGYGFTARTYGMNCDNVVAANVMLADGSLVHASPSTNADLFWALQGGTGNNFGVLLEITYRLQELYDVWGFTLQWPAADAPAALTALQSGFMRTGAPAELGYQLALITLNGEHTLMMFGIDVRGQGPGKAAIETLRGVGTPTFTDHGVASYATLNTQLLDVLPGPGPGGGTTYEVKRSGYIASTLDEQGWQEVVNYFATTPNPYNLMAVEPYGGAINSRPIDDSAFIHRDVDMDVFVDSFWQDSWTYNDADTARSWLSGFFDVLAPWLQGHMYQNYVVRDLADYRWQYWGDAFNTLLFVKQKYDPHNVFAFEQGISPFPPDDSTLTHPTRPSMFTHLKIDVAPGSRRPR